MFSAVYGSLSGVAFKAVGVYYFDWEVDVQFEIAHYGQMVPEFLSVSFCVPYGGKQRVHGRHY